MHRAEGGARGVARPRSVPRHAASAWLGVQRGRPLAALAALAAQRVQGARFRLGAALGAPREPSGLGEPRRPHAQRRAHHPNGKGRCAHRKGLGGSCGRGASRSHGAERASGLDFVGSAGTSPAPARVGRSWRGAQPRRVPGFSAPEPAFCAPRILGVASVQPHQRGPSGVGAASRRVVSPRNGAFTGPKPSASDRPRRLQAVRPRPHQGPRRSRIAHAADRVCQAAPGCARPRL